MFNKDLNWEQSQLNHITLKDTKHVALEAFFAYCYTGYIPMSSINEDLAFFTEKYNVTNLKTFIDKFVSIYVVTPRASNPYIGFGNQPNQDGINGWIKWLARLDMKNTTKNIKKWKPWNNAAFREICKHDDSFSYYLYSVYGDSDCPAYGKLIGNLSFSDRIMINDK